MKRLIIYLKRFFLVLITLIVIYFILAIVLSLFSSNKKELNCIQSEKIYITSNGIHLDIIIPYNSLSDKLKENLQISDRLKYISFGWGDKEFYFNTPTWSDLTFSTTFKALFLKSESAMHVTFYSSIYTNWKKINLCKIQIEDLNLYIENSFKKDYNDKFVKINVSGYSSNDFFYEANSSFSFYRTCNVWVNEALKNSNIKTSIWSPFVYGILYHIEE